MNEIIVVRHREGAKSDRCLIHLEKRGYTLRPVSPYLGEALPVLDGRTAGVVFEGGPQLVSDLDRHPYLADEMDFAGRAMGRGVPLLAICLGAQVLARHLGARVAGHPEGYVAFGYYPLKPTAAGSDLIPEGLHVPAGNVQGFDLPAGATLLAEGEIFPNQAFRVDGAVYAFQFHPEATRPIWDRWQTVLAGNYGKPGAQTRAQQDAGFDRYDGPLDAWFTGFLDRLFGDPSGDRPPST